MEKDLDIIEQTFLLEEGDIRTYSALSLAFIGDCVFDLVIRTIVVTNYRQAVNDLHKKSVKIVKAESQAKIADAILDILTEEEEAIYKRGRNAKSNTSAKNASIVAYRKATGLEALVGYLYLHKRMDRITELIKIGMEKCELGISKKG